MLDVNRIIHLRSNNAIVNKENLLSVYYFIFLGMTENLSKPTLSKDISDKTTKDYFFITVTKKSSRSFGQ